MENQQQYYPQTPLQQMPPVKKTKPLYKKWWFWTFMVCNAFVIGILFLSLLAAVDENLKYQAALQEANEKISQLESQMSSLEYRNENIEQQSILQDSEMLSSINNLLAFEEKIVPKLEVSLGKKTFSLLSLFNFHIRYSILQNNIYDLQRGISKNYDDFLSIHTNYISAASVFLLSEKNISHISEEDCNKYMEELKNLHHSALHFYSDLYKNNGLLKPENLTGLIDNVSQSYNIVLKVIKLKEEIGKRFGDIELTDVEIKELVDKILPRDPEMDDFSAKHKFFLNKEQEWEEARRQILLSTPLHSKTVDEALFSDFYDKSTELINAFFDVQESVRLGLSEETIKSFAQLIKKERQKTKQHLEEYNNEDNKIDSLIKIEKLIIDEIHPRNFPKHFKK